jgi:NTP pyrophosphatase (non-canonical NTP hydrolase)
MTDKNTTLQELKDMVTKFSLDRDWRKYHTQKQLAISICLEAAELLENFQWDGLTKQDKKNIEDELSDVLFNVLNFAIVSDIDIATSFRDKFKRIEEKFPVEKFNKDRDIVDDFNDVKKKYRAKK